MKKLLSSVLTIAVLSSIVLKYEVQAKESSMVACKHFYEKISKYSERSSSEIKELQKCSSLKHVPSMCAIANYLESGKHDFKRNRKKAYILAKEAISISKEDAYLCDMIMISLKYH